MLKAKEAGLAQHHADQNPAVIKARKELQDSEKFLSDFEYAYTLSANLDAIDYNTTVSKYNWQVQLIQSNGKVNFQKVLLMIHHHLFN